MGSDIDSLRIGMVWMIDYWAKRIIAAMSLCNGCIYPLKPGELDDEVERLFPEKK